MTAINKNQTIIVTGLPRSGTSMMMKMLEAGGVPPLCDGLRAADSDNPNGYYEFEAVKRTKEDSSWLAEAPGRAVKMVYKLLYDLPENGRYEVIFMRRDLKEILASQQQMLQNKGIATGVSDRRMALLFEHEIARFQDWLATAPHIFSVEVPYNDIASGSHEPIQAINDHLGGRLDTAAMAAVVDPGLYRNRAA